MTTEATRAPALAVQETLGLGTDLRDVTFVVVDLETTGGSPRDCGITEIGAVKVRGGEVIGELQTFVNPGEPIPPFIQSLTGITDAMVRDAPRSAAAVTSFLEFAKGAVLVAHNARFDISFLKAACAAAEMPWPRHDVLDTVHLARQVMRRDEVRNHKLSTLAVAFGATTTPDHRALHDARATVDVLHGLIGRLGSLGVTTFEELASYTSRVTPEQRRKRHLARDLPNVPGVYVFKDGQGRPLYVGVSVDIRTRVGSYFTASEQRSRMSEMVRIAESVTPIPCATTLEARVRELRLIASAKPRYNRRSRHPERAWWVRLTDEPFPRLSVVKRVHAGDEEWMGPFRSKSSADEAVQALHEVVPLRQCLVRISPTRHSSPCVLADMGRCAAPCIGGVDVEGYGRTVAQARTALRGDARPVLAGLQARMSELSGQERYEDAGTVRDRLAALVRGVARSQRASPLLATAELVAARRSPVGGWDLVCIRHGRLAGSTSAPRGADPMPYVEALRASAEVVPPPAVPGDSALPDETELLLRWLEEPGTRVVDIEGTWTCPVGGAAAAQDELAPALGWAS
ncbi:DEDD exonuclease domain-containing protein [Janibacter melonis]|uniref:Endonuclease n=1 Tax=Janibacter melonis TaxID=262209 RepID=A0A176QB35_9MICO|nr:DEDD exonuclease domain-containing protein [Janibacter melonis]MBD5830789.1 DEDD exnuclease domain-containing protein [Janibacter melonis]OAB86890.1 endonuclease [Janibacter melonis]